MGGLACPESWPLALPDFLHLHAHQHQQLAQPRWRLPAASCISRNFRLPASEQQQQQQQHVQVGGLGQQLGMGMLMPGGSLAPAHSSTTPSSTGHHSGINAQHKAGGNPMSYCDLPLDLPEFNLSASLQLSAALLDRPGGRNNLHPHQQHQVLMHTDLDAHRHDASDAAALQLLHHASAAEWSPRAHQHFSAGACHQQQQVMHWADHIQQVAAREPPHLANYKQSTDGKQQQQAEHGSVGGDIAMEVFSAAVFDQWWLKDPTPLDPGGLGGAADPLLDVFLHHNVREAASAGGPAVELIGIQDYLPELDHDDGHPSKLARPSRGLQLSDVVSGMSLSSSDIDVEEEAHQLSSVARRLLQSSTGATVTTPATSSPELNSLDSVAALPRPAGPVEVAPAGGSRQPTGAALSRSSSRRTLSQEALGSADDPVALATAVDTPGNGNGSAVVVVEEKVVPAARPLSSTTAQVTGPSAAATVTAGAAGDHNSPGSERSKRKRPTATESPAGAQQKRSRRSAVAAPARATTTSQPSASAAAPAAASRKRTRQPAAEQPVEAVVAADQGEDTIGGPASGGGGKRRRTSPTAAATAPESTAAACAAAGDGNACKAQPKKASRKRTPAALAGVRAQAKEDDEAVVAGDRLLLQPGSSERESHVIAERRRRRSMNFMLATLGSLLPEEGNNPKPTDRLKVVAQSISYIKAMQLSLRTLTQKKAELTVAHSLLHSTRHVLATLPAAGVGGRDSKSHTGTCHDHNQPSCSSSCTCDASDATLKQEATDMDRVAGAGTCAPCRPVLTLDMFGPEAFITLTCSKSRPDLFWKTLLLLDQMRFKVVTAQKSTNDHMAYHSIHVDNKESKRDHKDLKSALERLIKSLTAAA